MTQTRRQRLDRFFVDNPTRLRVLDGLAELARRVQEGSYPADLVLREVGKLNNLHKPDAQIYHADKLLAELEDSPVNYGQACLELHRVTGDGRYLDKARTIYLSFAKEPESGKAISEAEALHPKLTGMHLTNYLDFLFHSYESLLPNADINSLVIMGIVMEVNYYLASTSEGSTVEDYRKRLAFLDQMGAFLKPIDFTEDQLEDFLVRYDDGRPALVIEQKALCAAVGILIRKHDFDRAMEYIPKIKDLKIQIEAYWSLYQAKKEKQGTSFVLLDRETAQPLYEFLMKKFKPENWFYIDEFEFLMLFAKLACIAHDLGWMQFVVLHLDDKGEITTRFENHFSEKYSDFWRIVVQSGLFSEDDLYEIANKNNAYAIFLEWEGHATGSIGLINTLQSPHQELAEIRKRAHLSMSWQKTLEGIYYQALRDDEMESLVKILFLCKIYEVKMRFKQ